MKSVSTFSFLFILSLLSTISIAQPAIQWKKCLGGTGDDYPYDIITTSDSCYVIVGATTSNNFDVSVLTGGFFDYWLVKLNRSGTILWEKTFGGTDMEECFSVKQTNDKGFILAGHTSSNNVQVTGSQGGEDYWIVKTDSLGNLEWQKCLGGSSTDWGLNVILTNDNGYLINGFTASSNGMVTGNHGISDYWVAKLDSAGNLLSQKCLGGSDYDNGQSICNTSDGGYAVLGRSNSSNGDVTDNYGGYDYWLVKLDSALNILWDHNYGGSSNDGLNTANLLSTIIETSDSGFIIAGGTFSNDIDITYNHGDADFWVTKLDSAGIIQWQKCYGGTLYDYGLSIQETSGGFIMAGTTASNDFDVSGNHGGYDYWVLKIDTGGAIIWQKTFGGSSFDQCTTIKNTFDGGYIVSGYTNSNDGDVVGFHGVNEDMWIVKLEPDTVTGIISHQEVNPQNFIFPNPFTAEVYITIKSPQKLTIYNLMSQVVFEKTASNLQAEKIKVDLSALIPGIYEVIITGDNKSSGQKIIKQ